MVLRGDVDDQLVWSQRMEVQGAGSDQLAFTCILIGGVHAGVSIAELFGDALTHASMAVARADFDVGVELEEVTGEIVNHCLFPCFASMSLIRPSITRSA